jgi:hypothetical protein
MQSTRVVREARGLVAALEADDLAAARVRHLRLGVLLEEDGVGADAFETPLARKGPAAAANRTAPVTALARASGIDPRTLKKYLQRDGLLPKRTLGRRHLVNVSKFQRWWTAQQTAAKPARS